MGVLKSKDPLPLQGRHSYAVLLLHREVEGLQYMYVRHLIHASMFQKAAVTFAWDISDMKDKRRTERGECNECDCIEYEPMHFRSSHSCDFCGHGPSEHSKIGESTKFAYQYILQNYRFYTNFSLKIGFLLSKPSIHRAAHLVIAIICLYLWQ